MDKKATITIEEKQFEFPILAGTEGELAFDSRALRKLSGYISFDDGYRNTGSCCSEITFIDGEKGVLRHRGYPIDQLAIRSDFLETAYLIIYGELPGSKQDEAFRGLLLQNAPVHEGIRHFFDGFPTHSHPMAVLSAMLNSLGCYYPEMVTNKREQDLEHFDRAVAILMSKVRTLTAMSNRMKEGLPFVYPKRELNYASNFLHMMFSEPYHDYVPTEEVAAALDLMFLLHADHEQNCSTSTVRMVASGGANLFASVAAGVCALWGPAHGGANMDVLRMLQTIQEEGDDGRRFVEEAKAGKRKLPGFGHAVYKYFDPRAKIIGAAAEKLTRSLGVDDPLLDIARNLEEAARKEDYFIQRNLYANVDFYSSIILRLVGIPLEMFTVMFAIGRMPGWIANWKEIAENPESVLHRPRQIYTGPTQRDYLPMADR